MTQPSLPKASLPRDTLVAKKVASPSRRSRDYQVNTENSDVLISAVISSYLLSHLHHVLQRAEYGAAKEGKMSQASNFAQLRKVLCMDARSMKDALALGMREGGSDKFHESNIGHKAA